MVSTVNAPFDPHTTQVPIPPQPSSPSCCGGRTWSWIDPYIGTLASGSTAVTCYTAYLNTTAPSEPAKAFAILSGCVTIALAGGYAFLRKLAAQANLRAALDVEHATSANVLAAARTEGNAAAHVDDASHTAAHTAIDMGKKAEELEGALRTSTEALHEAEKSASNLKTLNETLSKQNLEQSARIEKLQTAINSLKGELQQFVAENRAFGTGVVTMGNEVATLGTHRADLSNALETVDSRIDEDISQFGALVKETKSSTQEIITRLSHQIEQLQAQIKLLSASVSHLDAEDDELETKTKLLVQLEERTTQVRGELEKLEQEFTATHVSFTRERALWTEERAQMDKTRLAFAQENNKLSTVNTGFTQVASDLAATSSRMEDAARRYANADAALSKELEDLSK